MRDFRLFFTLILVSFIAGCSINSRTNLEPSVYFQQGYQDALTGLHVNWRQNQAMLGKTLSIESQQQYDLGYAQATSEYCTPENAVKTASDGINYLPICRGISREKFMNAYRLGQSYRSIESSLVNNEKQIALLSDLFQSSVVKKELRRLRDSQDQLKTQLLAITQEMSSFNLSMSLVEK